MSTRQISYVSDHNFIDAETEKYARILDAVNMKCKSKTYIEDKVFA